jgi:hypothetical protein
MVASSNDQSHSMKPSILHHLAERKPLDALMAFTMTLVAFKTSSWTPKFPASLAYFDHGAYKITSTVQVLQA